MAEAGCVDLDSAWLGEACRAGRYETGGGVVAG